MSRSLPPPPHTLLRQCVIAMACLASAGTAMAQASVASPSSTRQPVLHLDIPASSLADAITRLAAAAGVFLASSSQLTDGRSSPGLRGDYTLHDAFERMLAGSGLEAVRTADNQYALRRKPSPGQQSAGAPSLPQVTVSAAADGEVPLQQRLNPPSSIASKLALTHREIANTVDVITQERLQQQNLLSLDEALKAAPGVVVFQSDADRVQYYSRGYPISSMQVDGVPVVVNPDMSSTAGTNSAQLTMYERVEVLDGPSGLYNGLGTVGGTINLVRKRAPEQFRLSADVGLGTSSNQLASVDVGGPLNQEGTLRARVAASTQNQDLRQDGRWRRDRAVYATVEADLSADTLVRAGLSHSRRTSNVGWANANALFEGKGPSVVAGSPDGFYGADWNRDQYNSSNAFASIEHRMANEWKLVAAADFTYHTARVLSGEIFSNVNPDTHQVNFGTTNTDYWERNTALDVYATGNYELFGRKHALTLGANYTHMNNYGTSYYGPNGNNWFITPVDYFNIHFPQPSWSGAPADTNKGAAKTTQFGIYGNTRFKLRDDLTAVVGARVSHWKNDFSPDALYNPFQYPASQGKYNAKVTPYAGLLYDIDAQWTVYGSYSTVFQPQTVRKRGGDLVAPIEGNQYEVGLKGTHLDGRLNTAVALFQITQKNRALADPTDPSYTYYIAQGEARTRGVDLRASGELVPGWTLQAGYTYSHNKFDQPDSIDAYASNFSQVAPRHLFKVWSNWRLPGTLNQWEVGAGVNASSQLYYDGNTYKVTQGGFYTADMRVAYHINPQLTLNLNVSNLFNRTYFQPMWNSVVYAPGRQAMLTLRARF